MLLSVLLSVRSLRGLGMGGWAVEKHHGQGYGYKICVMPMSLHLRCLPSLKKGHVTPDASKALPSTKHRQVSRMIKAAVHSSAW